MKTSCQKTTWILALILLVMSMSACSNKAAAPAEAPGKWDSEKIVIHGLQDQDFEITLGELKKLPTVTRHGEATRANGERVSVDATGPLLDTFLGKYGKTQKDFSRIRFTAADRYSIAVPSDVLANRQIILSYSNDGKPLADDMQPVRVVIPGERAMYWVRKMTRMDFETGGSQKPPNKVVFLDTAVGNLPQENYKYFDSVDKAVKVRDLITRFADISDQTVADVLMKAGDGLEKNETKANFLAAYIKITGKDAPKFLAPQFPQGMHIRDLLFITFGQTVIFDYAEGVTCLPKLTLDGKQGLAFSQVFKETGLTGGSRYRFTSANGKSVELNIADLGDGGIICQNSRGVPAFFCSGPSGSYEVDNLLSIEVLP